MTLLVTGATGHVGYEIVRRAAGQGIDVLAIYHNSLPEKDPGEWGANVRWESRDLVDAAAVADIARDNAVDACIHAAAISNEAYARPAPLTAIATNVGATANLLDAARVAAWRRFVLVSTGSVFQRRADAGSPIPEDAPTEPRNIYGTTKVGAEMLTRMYRSEFALSASSVRISWVYGPPIIADSPTRGPIPSFLLRALRGEAIREPGADFAASFTYVRDVADGLIAVATAPRLRFDIYHLGSGINYTVQQAANAVRGAVPGAAIDLGPGTEPWTEFTAIRGPLAGSRLHEDTGFRPAYSLEAGVGAYADWMREHRDRWRAGDRSS
jgi:nucleoside-diphosphate-sugar epimerase